ncbi:MAG: CotH kinase family protein, partial [Bacteroidia bacterium]|nr:CotH kinase family protein [Bacteroidia bacterium]
GLPLLVIETLNGSPITSKEDYTIADLQIFQPNSMGGNRIQLPMQIRLRGNSTFNFEKKPYRLKLNTRQSILGMPAHRDWVLLANYVDKSLIRNELAFELSRRFGLKYTPRTRFVDVILNNKYIGNYQLAEQIEIDPNRVNISEMKVTDTSEVNISGGYLLEADERLDGSSWFYSQFNIPLVIKEPEPIQESQKTYISNYIKSFERALFFIDHNDTVSGYKSFINSESFIDWLLVNELSKNNDAIFFSSVFLYKNRNEKLTIGPVWDFDIAFGNVNYNFNDFPQGWWVRNHLWFLGLMSDTAFSNSFFTKWKQIKNTKLNTLNTYIDSLSSTLYLSQNLNYQVWQTLDSLVFYNPVAYGSYEAELDALKRWLDIRIHWIDKQINPEPILPFIVIEPQDSTSITFSNSSNASELFQWHPSNSSGRYYLKFESSDESNTDSLIFYSNYWSSDTTFTLENKHIIELNKKFNKDKKDDFWVKWNVYHFNETLFCANNEDRWLHVYLPNDLEAFTLVTPENNQEFIQSKYSNIFLNFTWAKPSEFATYELYFDSSENEAKPFQNWIQYPKTFTSNHALISIKEMLDLFSNNGYHKTDSLSVRWKVKANLMHHSVWSSTSFKLTIFEEKSTGLQSSLDASRISIFPNPAQDNMLINLSGLNQNTQLELFDLMGHKLIEENIEKGKDFVLQTRDYSKGIYLLMIRVNNNVVTKKLIFQ